MDNNYTVFLYGLSGVEKQYMALAYYGFFDGRPGETDKKRIATEMKMFNSSIKTVYAIDDRPGLKWDFMRSHKLQSIEDCIIFKDLLERYGNPITT